MVWFNFSVSSIYVWNKSEKRKKTNTRNFNFKKGLFVAPLPKGLGLCATSLENNAHAFTLVTHQILGCKHNFLLVSELRNSVASFLP